MISIGRIFFPFRVDSYSEEADAAKQTGGPKVVSFGRNGETSNRSVHSP